MELTEEEQKIFSWAFGVLNDEKDGNITNKELAAFMRCIGKTATESQLNSMINEVDTDGNGFIDFNEFVTALTRKLSGNLDDDEIRDAFRVFDKENTGFIGPDQLRSVFFDVDQVVHEDEIEEMIRNADQDGDGRLSYEEFVQMMSNR
ncbi:calmodulin-beta-like [Drosophila innubila]|uniref:calmodulin-beta-like n=1 Tax=Drosophila innubila TaxID=198719 RepID=UPI00148DE2D0|nr:calmodulin-beta-like [Drosophila innubila]